MQYFQKERAKQLVQLKKMGFTLFFLAFCFGLINYFLPNDETNYWLSSSGKEGTYTLCALSAFFGLYCFGATWRKNHFIS